MTVKGPCGQTAIESVLEQSKTVAIVVVLPMVGWLNRPLLRFVCSIARLLAPRPGSISVSKVSPGSHNVKAAIGQIFLQPDREHGMLLQPNHRFSDKHLQSGAGRTFIPLYIVVPRTNCCCVCAEATLEGA